MGCSTSRIDQLPAVSLCHDRCKFLEEALYQSYALADAHVAYMQSLKSLGHSLHRFYGQVLVNNQSESLCNGESVTVSKLSKPSSPDNCASSSTNSETSHIDFRSDSEDEEFRDGKDFDLLHRINPNQFNSYSYVHEYNKFDDPEMKTPPPPAPSSSAWDFLNFFETYERYDQLPAAKEKEFVKENGLEDKCGKNGQEDRKREVKSKAGKGNDLKQNEVNVAEKKVESEKEGNKETKDSVQEQAKNQSCLEVIKEVDVLFERAAESGNEVLKILDAGKFRFYYKNSAYQGISSKMLHTVNSSFLEKNGSVHVGFHEALGIISVNLSSTLRKLCLWEKKLYNEVKAEEKLRIILAKNCRLKNNLSESADAKKVNSMETLLRMLSTKIKVAIQVIDKISITINKLRDEELWPLISDLIGKLLGMWRVMLECHRSQYRAVVDTRSLDAIAADLKFNDAYLETAIQLKIEIQNWNLSFSGWITAQRGYVKALNGWLLRCLPSEPEKMPDNGPPYSPCKLGLPPVFAFFNQWSHAIDKVSETEVIYAMNRFFTSVNKSLEQHYLYLQQRLSADKDMEKQMKILEREGQRLQKVMQARTKMFVGFGVAVHQSEVGSNHGLQSSLKQIFMAIEQFSADTMQAYQELHVHIEDSQLDQANPKAP